MRWTRWDRKAHDTQCTPTVLANRGGQTEYSTGDSQPKPLEIHRCWVTRHPQKAGKNTASLDWCNRTWPHSDKLAEEGLPFPPMSGKMASLIKRSNQAGFTEEEWGSRQHGHSSGRPGQRKGMPSRKTKSGRFAGAKFTPLRGGDSWDQRTQQQEKH